MEEWYDVLGYEGLYEITETGKVRNCKTGTKLSGNINSHGYVVVSLTKNGKKKDCKLHRLLAMTFIPNPYDYDCVNHKDGNKLNNSIDNLEWCTKGYNNRHAREVLQVSTSPKPVYQSTMTGEFVALWATIGQAAKYAGVSTPCIVDCCEGRANSAGGYCWDYAGQISIDFLKDWERRTTLKRISKLEQQLSELRSRL